MAAETEGPGWSSLPADLVNRVADCLLATNDIDCYTDMRAVCHHWRSVTADPKSNQHDPRFLPSRWVLLDEHKASSAAAVTVDNGALLFVNTATGRFLRRTLLLPRDPGHAFVTSTTDGLLVLASTDPTHAVSVLNPFTGSLIRFAAPLPSELRLTADVRVGSSPTLVLVSVGRSWVYSSEPQSESFSVEKSHGNCPASRLPQIVAGGGNRSAAINRESVPTGGGGAANIFDQLRSQLSQIEDCCRCYAVVAPGGDLFAVLKRHDGMDVFKIDAAGNVIERVRSIGSLALFLGIRCLVVDTDCIPTVEPNCAYFQLIDLDGERHIYKFSIGTCGNEEEPELVSVAIGNAVSPCNDVGPFTVTQLLCNYTMDIPGQQLTWEGYSYLELEDYYDRNGHYNKYIDYESDEDWGYDDDYDYRPDDDCYYHLFDRDR